MDRAFRSPKFDQAIEVPASVVTLVSLLSAANQAAAGVHRLTVHNISDDNIEIATSDAAGDPPVTGSMDILEPGESISLEWEWAKLKTVYVKADVADSKAFVWAEGM